MGLILTHHLLEPVARGLLGSISCSGGPTPEQQRLLQALLTHLWERPDLRIAALEPMGPEELAVALGDPHARRMRWREQSRVFYNTRLKPLYDQATDARRDPQLR